MHGDINYQSNDEEMEVISRSHINELVRAIMSIIKQSEIRTGGRVRRFLLARLYSAVIALSLF